MINYESDVCTDRFIISIEGHADSAPAGQDLICAAASMLALTLIAAVRRIDEAGGLKDFYHSVNKGSVELDFTVRDHFLTIAEALTEAATEGFLMLEAKYPGNVRVS